MEMYWDLNSLYSDFSSEEFKNDFQQFSNIMEEMKDWQADNDSQPVKLAEEFLQMLRECYQLFDKLMAFSQLTVSVEAENEQALKTVEKLEKKISDLTGPRVRFQLWLQNQDNREELYQISDLLAEHKFLLEELVKRSQYLLSEKEEDLIAKMQQTGSSAWTKLQQKLTSTLLVSIELDGEKQQLPLPVVRNLAYRKESEVRKKAYQAELAAYQKIDKGVAAALNGIKGEVLTLVEKRGYASPLQKTLLDSRMKQETLDAMLAAIRDSLDDFRNYYRKKASLLGHQEALPFYDLFAPVGEVEMEFSYQEAADFIIKNIRPLSDEMADFIHTAFQENWIDAKPREGKRGGAFCYNLHPVKESRILANFNGSFNDMTTLAHELGHAYHGFCLQDESILNSDYPMPLAETASIFSETVVTEAAMAEADRQEKIAILENNISQAGQVIVDIYSRFIFESNLFEKRQQASLSVAELKSMMLAAQKEAYGDSLAADNLHPYMWLNKSHYYSAGNNFYNFPYAFGLLFGLGVYALRQQEGAAFMDKYNSLLRATGKNTVEQVAEKAGIDTTSKDFWLGSLALVKEDIDQFLKI